MKILCYTKTPDENVLCSSKHAASVHLAWKDDQGRYIPFHNDEGILYAKAVSDEASGVLKAKCIKSPWLFKMADGFGILAVRTEADLSDDETVRGKVLFFTSEDLVRYEEKGTIKLDDNMISEVRCEYNSTKGLYNVYWKTISDSEWKCAAHKELSENLLDIVNERHYVQQKTEVLMQQENVLDISDEQSEYLFAKLNHYYNTENEIKYPFAAYRADPNCLLWNDKYYFVATNDEDENSTLMIRCAKSVKELAYEREYTILDTNMYDDIKGLIWAPELHVIEGKLYIFFAASSDGFYTEKCYVMELKADGNPISVADWKRPVPVCLMDEGLICKEYEEICLDMSPFKYEDKWYAIWSQRRFKPVDQGAWLYIAQIDGKTPWKMLSQPVCIAKPEYGWENADSFVVEAPYAIMNNGKLMVTYSASAVDPTYSVGIMIHDINKSVLDPNGWKKSNFPILSARSRKGEYGTGHNSFLYDKDGNIWNFYHAMLKIDGHRDTIARKISFDIDGEPILD